MRLELPGMRHLMHRQPAAEFVEREMVFSGPGLDVGLDQDQRRSLDRFPAEQSRVVLTEDPAGQESEDQAQVTADASPAKAQHERTGNQPLELFEGLEHLTEDPHVEPPPLAASDRL